MLPVKLQPSMLTRPALHEVMVCASLLMLMAPPAPLPALKSVILTLVAELEVKLEAVMLRMLKLAA